VLDLADFHSRMVKGGAYEAAMRAKEEGLIDHVVFSTHCNGAEIQEIVDEGLFEGMTVGYNILNYRFRQQGVAAAARRGMGVVIMNPLGGGIIPQRAAKLDFLRSPSDPSVVEAALRFVASHREITAALPGMGTLDEVRQDCAVGQGLGKAVAAVTESLESLAGFAAARQRDLEGHLNAALDTLCTGCQYCLPCPESIPIPKFLLSYNEKIFGQPADALNMMKWHWGGLGADQADRCIECGECESRCTQHLPIIGRLKDIVEWDSAAKRAAALKEG
jgi:predicted aldo/keto reductase-like oxidoreductase